MARHAELAGFAARGACMHAVGFSGSLVPGDLPPSQLCSPDGFVEVKGAIGDFPSGVHSLIIICQGHHPPWLNVTSRRGVVALNDRRCITRVLQGHRQYSCTQQDSHLRQQAASVTLGNPVTIIVIWQKLRAMLRHSGSLKFTAT